MLPFQGEEYSGNIRFYFLSNGQEVAKVVRLTSNTTTTELVPILVEKFHAYINADMRYPELFNVVMKLGGERGGEYTMGSEAVCLEGVERGCMS